MTPTLRSPRFSYLIQPGALGPGQSLFLNLADIPQCAHEIPYNTVTVRNFSDQRLRVEYGDTVMIIGASEVFSDDEAYGTTSIKITNTSLVQQDDEIYIVIERGVSTNALLTAMLTGENVFKIANGDI